MKSIIVGFAVVLAGCDSSNITGLQEATPYDSPLLRTVWVQTEACSGLHGNFDRVSFFLAPNGIQRNGKWVGAIWDRDGNKIFLTPPFKDDPRTIMHEEMHALLQTTDHPPLYFNGVCGNLM